MVRQLLLMFLLTIENHTEIIKLRYALLYESLLCYVTSLYFMLRYVVLCCLLLCFIIFYYAILFDITSCYIVEDKPYSSRHDMLLTYNAVLQHIEERIQVCRIQLS